MRQTPRGYIDGGCRCFAANRYDMSLPIDFANSEVLLEKHAHGQLTTDRALEFIRLFPFREHCPGEELRSDAEVADHAWCGFFVAWRLYQGAPQWQATIGSTLAMR
jgi:hypothetical protein